MSLIDPPALSEVLIDYQEVSMAEIDSSAHLLVIDRFLGLGHLNLTPLRHFPRFRFTDIEHRMYVFVHFTLDACLLNSFITLLTI